jgi:hypothetical protein
MIGLLANTGTLTEELHMAVTEVIVSGELGRFTSGQVLTDRNEIAEYYRLSVNEGADEKTTLTNDQILIIIDEVDVTGFDPDDVDVLRTEALNKGLVKEIS